MLPKRLARKTIYESEWINLYLDKVRFADGRVIEEHHFISFDHDSAGVVVQNGDGEFLLIRSARYTTQSLEWEIPAGGVDEGETPRQAAAREVLEETGYSISDPELLCVSKPLNGIADKIQYIFRARADKKGRALTPEEVVDTRWFSPAEIRDMIRGGDISCDLSLAGLLMALCGF